VIRAPLFHSQIFACPFHILDFSFCPEIFFSGHELYTILIKCYEKVVWYYLQELISDNFIEFFLIIQEKN
jgi:hypothetical protein